MKAREAFAAGRYDDALELFAKLYAETLHPVYLRNIGRCHQKMRQPEKAIDKFREYLAKEKKIPADERKEIDGYIKEMEALRDEQAKQAAPPPPAIPPPPVDADQSAAAAAAERRSRRRPRRPRRRRWSRSRRRRRRKRPIYKKWWFWTGIGVVVAGGVVAAVAAVERRDDPAGVSRRIQRVHVSRARRLRARVAVAGGRWRRRWSASRPAARRSSESLIVVDAAGDRRQRRRASLTVD